MLASVSNAQGLQEGGGGGGKQIDIEDLIWLLH